LEGSEVEGQQPQQKDRRRRRDEKIKKPKGVGHFLQIDLSPHAH